MPVPSPISRLRDRSSGLPPRPGAADVARGLSLVVHDLRGPFTAVQAFARFLDDQARESLDSTAASWLDGCRANAELASHLCEALSVLEGSCVRSGAPLALVIPSAAARLQKFLARGRVALKVSGDFPDRQFERRRLGFVVEAVLVAVAHSVGAGPCRVEISGSEHEERVKLIVACDREAAGLDGLALRMRGGDAAGLSEMALQAALIDLGARLAAPEAGVLEIRLRAADEGLMRAVRGRRAVAASTAAASPAPCGIPGRMADQSG